MKIFLRLSLRATAVAWAFLTGVLSAHAQTTTWDGSFANSWFDPSHWSAGVPNSTTEAAITDGTVIIDTTGAAASSINMTTGHGQLSFQNSATATGLTINMLDRNDKNVRDLLFQDTSSADNAIITLSGAGNFLYSDAVAGFSGNATAGTATLTLSNDAQVGFYGSATAGSATLINNDGGLTGFAGADAGSAHIINNAGGWTWFEDNGGAGGATITNNAGGVVDASWNSPVWGGNNSLSIGSLSGAGNIYLGSVNLTLGALNNDDVISGVIADGYSQNLQNYVDAILGPTIFPPLSGAALTKVGTGTLTLSGDNTYTGDTDVMSGTLVVDGSIASSALTTVHSGGQLAGTGNVGATDVQAGGTIAPGDSVGQSVGTLNIAGAYSQAAGSTYQAQLNPGSSASDRVAITGAATLLPGAIVDVSKAGSGAYQVGTTYTILTTTSGLTGTFVLAGDTAISAFLALSDTYDANNAYIVVEQTGTFESIGRTPNQIHTATGVSSLPAGNPIVTALLNSPSDDAARHNLDELSGDLHASAKTAFIEDSHFLRDAATDRLREAFCGVAVEASERSYNDGSGSSPDGGCRRSRGLTTWAQGFGSWGHTDGDGNAGSLDRTVGGLLFGLDASVFDGWRAGVLGGYSRTSFDVDSRNSSGSSDDYYVGSYGGTQWGALGLRLGGGYAWHDLETHRFLDLPGIAGGLVGNYQDQTAQVFGDLGYRIDLNGVAFEPFTNLAYVNLHSDGFQEHGGAAALSGRGSTFDATFSTTGLRASTTWVVFGTCVDPTGSIAWRHLFNDDTPGAVLSFDGGTPFGIAGVPVGQDAAVVDAGVNFHPSDSVLVDISYGGQFSDVAVDQSIRGRIDVQF